MTRRNLQARALLAAAGAAALMAGCGEDGNKGGPSPGVLRAEIVGPSTIAPGQTANYSVVEHLAGGGTRALPTAAWASSNPSLVQVSESGVASAQPRTGETVLTVKTTVTALKEVIVLPAGTFRLVGRVGDAAVANVPIPDARVEVPDGPSATTDTTGLFRLYGVPADAELRLSRDGYESKIERVHLSGHTSRNFTMNLDGTLRNFTGPYTLTIEGAPGCPGTPRPLAPELRRRTYDAVVTQNGSRVEVTVAGPALAGDRFSGHLTLAGANFLIDWGYYDIHSQLTERLQDGAYLVIWGTATTSGSPAGLSGRFSGGFEHFTYPPWETRGSCGGATFSLTPR